MRKAVHDRSSPVSGSVKGIIDFFFFFKSHMGVAKTFGLRQRGGGCKSMKVSWFLISKCWQVCYRLN